MADRNVERARRTKYLILKPRVARFLSAYALGAIHLWFLTKLLLPSASGRLEMTVGFLALSGMIGAIVFFLCSYGFLANAPDGVLDERQLADRNRAYVGAFKYLTMLLLFAGIGAETTAKLLDFELSTGVMQNFLTLAFIVALILPATLLAWNERYLPDAEIDA